MNEDEKLILYYLLMSTGMLPAGFIDLLREETREQVKKYQTAIEEVINKNNK